MDALGDWVRDGGNLVLTDGALRALPDLSSIDPDAIRRQTVYAGQTAFATAEDEDTLDDPLADDVDQEGARFGAGMRRQTFEPTPLGFAIQNAGRRRPVQRPPVRRRPGGLGGGRRPHRGDLGRRRRARRGAGLRPRHARRAAARRAARSGSPGALLPQPSQEFDHTLGLEPYATTYTGYILICNLLDCTILGGPPPPGGEEPPPGGEPPPVMSLPPAAGLRPATIQAVAGPARTGSRAATSPTSSPAPRARTGSSASGAMIDSRESAATTACSAKAGVTGSGATAAATTCAAAAARTGSTGVVAATRSAAAGARTRSRPAAAATSSAPPAAAATESTAAPEGTGRSSTSARTAPDAARR